MRAAIGAMAPQERRGAAFGLFHTIFGIAWFIGSALLGIPYDHSIPALVTASLVLQLGGIPVLIWTMRQRR
jgi:predicted MFS family arabinose efflux permease